MPVKKFGFPKNERLSSKKAIASLFENGESFFSYPFSVFWIDSTDDLPCQAQTGISVSKKSFKKAVDRNYIKRIIREAWRKQKYLLYKTLKQENRQLTIMIVYTAKKIPDYESISIRIEELIEKFSVILSASSDPEN